MEHIRAFFHSRRRLAALVIALTLVIKALVPVGYMVGTESHALTIEVCGGQRVDALSIALPVKVDGTADAHAKAGNECPYSGLAMASLAGADALLLAGALLFVLALGFAPVAVPSIPRRTFLTPPLRGPPVLS